MLADWTNVPIPLPESGPLGLPAGDDLVLYEIDWHPIQDGPVTHEVERTRGVTRAQLFCEHVMRPGVLQAAERIRWTSWPA